MSKEYHVHLAIYISSKRLGTIVSFTKGSCPFLLEGYDAQGKVQRIDLIATDKVMDDALRSLSNGDYLITTDNTVMYKNNSSYPIYKTSSTLPIACQHRVIPILKEADIIDYSPVHQIDDVFIQGRYAKELKDAEYILVPPSIEGDIYPIDLLIEYKDGDSYVSFGGRTTENPKIEEIEGKYVYLSSIPVYTGSYKNMGLSYTKDSLREKCKNMQDKLNDYGRKKIQSMIVAINSIPDRLEVTSTPFKASTIYDDLVTLIDRLKSLT